LVPPHTAKNNVQTTTYERSERGLKNPLYLAIIFLPFSPKP